MHVYILIDHCTWNSGRKDEISRFTECESKTFAVDLDQQEKKVRRVYLSCIFNNSDFGISITEVLWAGNFFLVRRTSLFMEVPLPYNKDKVHTWYRPLWSVMFVFNNLSGRARHISSGPGGEHIGKYCEFSSNEDRALFKLLTVATRDFRRTHFPPKSIQRCGLLG